MKALEGVRILDMTHVQSGPTCTQLLAWMGADVIKVEVPWGEVYRHNTPRMAGYQSDFPESPPYHMENRGKRSLTLDLALPQALEALHKAK